MLYYLFLQNSEKFVADMFICFHFLQQNKQILTDAVVHAVNEDYYEMANDFTRLGFLAAGTDVSPIVPALEAIWQDSAGKGLADFNFRSVTGRHFHFIT
jgi:predicted unusual protein kinase regulating ubiquinone biosynthesis (AarF/ABC1/UbiB family)